jgi:hypothetical protein
MLGTIQLQGVVGVVEKKNMNPGSWKDFLVVSVKTLGFLAMLFAVAYGMFLLRRSIPHR